MLIVRTFFFFKKHRPTVFQHCCVTFKYKAEAPARPAGTPSLLWRGSPGVSGGAELFRESQAGSDEGRSGTVKPKAAVPPGRPNPARAQPPHPGSLDSAPAAFPAETHISRRRVLVLQAAVLALPAAGGARHPAAAGAALTVPHGSSRHSPAHATPLPRAQLSRELRAYPCPARRRPSVSRELPPARAALVPERALPRGTLRTG